MENQDKDNVFKNLATILSLLLPIVQVFVSLLPATSKRIILFNDQFTVISVLAAIVAYLLIVAFKSTVWFSYTFQRVRREKYDAQQLKINTGVYEEKELRKIVKDGAFEKAPYYITPLNIYYLLLPIIIVCLLLFVSLGLFFNGTHQSLIIFLQALFYIFLVSLTSLTLGVLYINDLNKNRREHGQATSWERLKALVYVHNALPEIPEIDFVAELQINPSNQSRLRTIIRVGNEYYAIDSDLEVKKIFEVSKFKPADNTVKPFTEGMTT